MRRVFSPGALLPLALLAVTSVMVLYPFGMVLYGTHVVRPAVTAMRPIFAGIRADGGIHNVDKRIVSVEVIFELQRVAEMKRTEQKYLR